MPEAVRSMEGLGTAAALATTELRHLVTALRQIIERAAPSLRTTKTSV